MGVGKPLFSFVFCFVMGVKAGKEVGLCTNFSTSFLVKYSFQFLLKAPCPLLSTSTGLSNWETGRQCSDTRSPKWQLLHADSQRGSTAPAHHVGADVF